MPSFSPPSNPVAAVALASGVPNFDAENLQTLLESTSNMIKSLTHARLRVHAASEELQILRNIEARVMNSHANNLSALRFRCNQLSPVNGVPDEILLMIFLYATNNNVSSEMLQYLPLTWICRRWRALALNSPILWRLIDFSCPNDDILEEILRRSKDAKLWVGHFGPKLMPVSSMNNRMMCWAATEYNSWCSDKEYGTFIKYILPVLSRVEALEMRLSNKHWMDTIPLLQELVPSLRRCRFRIQKGESDAETAYTRHTDVFISEVFGSLGLEELGIHYDHLSLARISAFPRISNLRTLELGKDRRPGTAADSPPLELHLILRILQSCCSNLEHLEVFTQKYGDSGVKSSSTPLSHPRIIMPLLSTLKLNSPTDTQVIEYLSTPALQTLAIDSGGMQHVSPSFYCDNFPHVVYENERVFGYKSADIEGQQTPGLTIDTASALYCNQNDPRFTEFATPCALWAAHISSLTVKDMYWDRLVQCMLQHAHGLRSLRSDKASAELLDILRDATICPQLESLSYSTWSQKPGKQLVSAVMSRRKAGNPLKAITLYAKRPMASTHLEKLEKYVKFTCIEL